MEKPKRSSFPSGRQGSTKYAAAMKAWRAKQPKKWRPLSALDKDRTAWEKERKSRNPEKRVTVGTGRSKKTKIVPNPNYKRPTEGQRGYSPDASGTKKHEVDMEAIKKIVAKQKGGSKEKKTNTNTNTKSQHTTGQDPKVPSNYPGGYRGGQGAKTTQSNKEAWRTPEAEKWLKKTRNSPAAKLKTRGKPTFSDKERWLLQKQHRDWKAKRGR